MTAVDSMQPVAHYQAVGRTLGPGQPVVQLVVKEAIPVLDAVDAAVRWPVAIQRLLGLVRSW